MISAQACEPILFGSRRVLYCPSADRLDPDAQMPEEDKYLIARKDTLLAVRWFTLQEA